MPRVSVGHDHDLGEEARREQLLALREMRRGVERRAAPGESSGGELVALARARVVRALEELVDALDRRVPRTEQN